MKNNISIFVVLSGLFVLTSCKKNFLEKTPPDKLPLEGFFNSEQRALAGVNAAYIPLASENLFGGDNISLRLFDPPAGDVILSAAISGVVFNKFAFSADDPHLLAF
ncbi:MAG TPA: hypothetical protein VK618_11525, partial [Flavitalea sp.]|nr:hypothetical protein [Flavitalea sp.]